MTWSNLKLKKKYSISHTSHL